MTDTEGASVSFRDFIDKLVTEKGLTTLEPEVRAELVKDLEKRLESLIHSHIVNALNSEALEKFEQLLDSNYFWVQY